MPIRSHAIFFARALRVHKPLPSGLGGCNAADRVEPDRRRARNAGKRDAASQELTPVQYILAGALFELTSPSHGNRNTAEAARAATCPISGLPTS